MLAAFLDKRDLSRLALFLEIRPLETALSKARAALTSKSRTSFASFSTASLNFLTAVLNLLNSAALRLLAVALVLTRLIAYLICGIKITSIK